MSDRNCVAMFGLLALILSDVESGLWSRVWAVLAFTFFAIYWANVWVERKERKARR